MLHIRTCSDSGRALLQLLTYYINNGDLNQENITTASAACADTSTKTDEELVTVDQYEHILSESQQEQLTEMLQEAMQESPQESKSKRLLIYVATYITRCGFFVVFLCEKVQLYFYNTPLNIFTLTRSDQ